MASVYPFPSSNLSLTQVLTNYRNQNPSLTFTSMNSLRGQSYYDPDGTPRTIPPVGTNFSLSILLGKFSLEPTSVTITVTSVGAPPPPPAGRPPPTGYLFTLIGGGGGGGGNGGDFNYIGTGYSGGKGAGGGGGGYTVTPKIPYGNGTVYAQTAISVLPFGGTKGGRGGFDGQFPRDGDPGGPGGIAALLTNGQAYAAEGGGQGSGGEKGKSTGAANGNGGAGGNGINGSGQTGAVDGTALDGSGQSTGAGGIGGKTTPDGGGTVGNSGQITVTFFFT